MLDLVDEALDQVALFVQVLVILGGARTSATDLIISQPSLGDRIRFLRVDLEGRSFKRPLYYGFRAGFFPRRNFPLAAEVELIHLKVFAKAGQRVPAAGEYGGKPLNRQMSLGEVVQQYSISHGVNLLLLNAVARRAMGKSEGRRRGRLILAGRLGVGPTIPHAESTVGGQHQVRTGSIKTVLTDRPDLRLINVDYLVSLLLIAAGVLLLLLPVGNDYKIGIGYVLIAALLGMLTFTVSSHARLRSASYTVTDVMKGTSIDSNRYHSPSVHLLQIYLPLTRQLRGMRPRFDGGRDFY